MPMSSPNHNVPSLIYVTCSLDIVDNYRYMVILLRASYPLQRLPESAVVVYGDYLGDNVVLKVPNGEKWPIGLTSRDGKRNGKGPAFPLNAPPSFFKVVLDDTLRDGKIKTVDLPCTYPTFTCSYVYFDLVFELKIPPIGSMKYEDFIGDKMFLEVPNGLVWPVELSRRDCEIWLRRGWLKFARFYFLELGCLLLFTYKGVYSHFQVRIFRRNTLEMDYFNLSDEDETDSNSSGEIECQRMKHDKERRTHGGDGGMSAAHRSPKVLSRTAQSELEDKTERAFAKARSFKSRNPFVVIRMRPSYISTHLKLPIYFAQEHICESGERKVTLKISDMRSWSVKCIIQVYNCQTCARFQDHGWKAFARDNRLEEGDVCVLEVIPNTSKCALKVYIFRDKDQ
ncbi:hypothetical protein ACFX14_027122 [Malus domestica]